MIYRLCPVVCCRRCSGACYCRLRPPHESSLGEGESVYRKQNLRHVLPVRQYDRCGLITIHCNRIVRFSCGQSRPNSRNRSTNSVQDLVCTFRLLECVPLRTGVAFRTTWEVFFVVVPKLETAASFCLVYGIGRERYRDFPECGDNVVALSGISFAKRENHCK